ncbi:hypothetical protein J3F84DRAFT_369779 [Trichoderma pleuroticola]
METKDPHPGAKKGVLRASALMLQVCCYIQPAEITSARPRFCAPRPQPIPSANRRLYPLVGSLGRFSQGALAPESWRWDAWQRGHSLSAEASGIIQSKAPRLSRHQKVPANSCTRHASASPTFAHCRKRRSRIGVQSHKPPHTTNMALPCPKGSSSRPSGPWPTRTSSFLTIPESRCT